MPVQLGLGNTSGVQRQVTRGEDGVQAGGLVQGGAAGPGVPRGDIGQSSARIPIAGTPSCQHVATLTVLPGLTCSKRNHGWSEIESG